MTQDYVLAIDQGTSSTKALVFDKRGKRIAKGTALLQTRYFNDGWVEQDPEEIWQNVLQAVNACLEDLITQGYSSSQIKSIGISNQRETFVVWDDTEKPLYNAIVWQCKRSIGVCQELKKQGLEARVIEKTGLLLDPYFSGTKLIWLVQQQPKVKTALENGNLHFGTIDSWLLFKMTNGAVHACDHTNASRTLLFNLKDCSWDQELISNFGLSGIQLPKVYPSSHEYGYTDLNGLLPAMLTITALVGDSQAAAFGEGCFEPGMAKATMGTGCSVMMNIGSEPVISEYGMVTTIAWSRGNEVSYGLEGVIVSCGSTLEWLKNSLGLFVDPAETASMATAIADSGGVYLIPAFSGLGSPYWQMNRKASIHGLDFGSSKEHLVRAALESIAYQIKDVVEAMMKDAGKSFQGLKADGGISTNEFLVQFISDLLDGTVETIGMPDVSALGAAYLSGLESGVYQSLEAIKSFSVASKSYTPGSNSKQCLSNYQQWLHWISIC